MRKSIILFLALLIFPSCNLLESNSNNLEFLSSNILPLAPGNYWKYEYNEYKDDSIIVSRTKEVNVISDTTVFFHNEQILLYKLKEILHLPDLDTDRIMYYLLGIHTDGIYWYGHSMRKDGNYFFNKHYHIKYPVKVGDKWIHDHDDYHIDFECISVNDTILYKNESYKCLRIRTGIEVAHNDKFYTEGIGLIEERSTRGWYLESNLSIYKLTDYFVKQ